MLKDKSAYFSTYDIICNLFEKTMQQVFTNEFSYEEMRFHSFLIVRNDDDAIQNVYYDDKELENADLPEHSNRVLIDTYIKTVYRDYSYILKETGSFREDGLFCKIYWVYLSEYLDKNYGKLFLNCLLDELEDKFNEYLEKYIQDSQEWSDLLKNRDIEGEAAEVIRSAELAVDSLLDRMFISYIRYFIDSVAGEYYEKSECRSNLAFFSNQAATHLKSEQFAYHLTDVDFVPSNSRLIRKLLQMAQDSLYLVLCESEDRQRFSVKGLCAETELEKMNPEKGQRIKVPYVKVNIKRHMQWDLFLNDAYIISSRNGRYKISHTLQDLSDCLLKYIDDYFKEEENEKDTHVALRDHIIESSKQGHGTMLVIVDCAEAEKMAKHFGDKKYAYADSEPRGQLEYINQLNAIDGAVLMDTKGKVHAIGTILDGLIQSEGNLARGARWNSAVKFLDKLQEDGVEKAMIFIVSEDGFADVLDLRDE